MQHCPGCSGVPRALQAGIDLENRTQILTTFTEDMGEAVQAFLSKRPPEFRNR